ncbi:hypothetical protein ACFOW1_16980 [Parasediminibacterium paludis]|uniref:Uncharacterized protein n=1 Tax=Parasediminibacterium paludis TaxID=908966 RepID=A0ABV8PZR0_9BACT
MLYHFDLQPLDAQIRIGTIGTYGRQSCKGAFIITLQVPVNKWFSIIGEQTIADVILGRIIFNAH